MNRNAFGVAAVLCIAQCFLEESVPTMSMFGDSAFGENRPPRNPLSASGKLTSGNVDGRVALQCDFERNGVHTVQVTMQAHVPAAIVPDAIAAKIKVRWVTDGNAVERICTIGDGNGLSISGVSDGVQVEVSDMSQGAVLGVVYDISISASNGMRADAKVPPTFVDPAHNTFLIAGAGGLATFVIPDGIGASSVNVQVARFGAALGTAILDQEVVLFQTDDGANNLAMCDPRQMDWVPLAPGCTKLVLVNEDPVAGHNIFFTVTLGVDG